MADDRPDMARLAGQDPARRLILELNGDARAKSRAHFLWGLSIADAEAIAFAIRPSALFRGGANLPLICLESDITVT